VFYEGKMADLHGNCGPKHNFIKGFLVQHHFAHCTPNHANTHAAGVL
jgi:hypothetical protein